MLIELLIYTTLACKGCTKYDLLTDNCIIFVQNIESMALRYNIKPFLCIPNVVCGDDIEALWGNEIRDLGQSAFQRGDTVLSAGGHTVDGIIRGTVGGGFCWNMVQGYGSGANRAIIYTSTLGLDVIFQPAYPYFHHCAQMYEGSIYDGLNIPRPDFGSPINNNGILGKQIIIGRFENAGYNTAQVIATVRRGKRCVKGAPAHITALASNIQIYEFKEDDTDPLAYIQHIQCWYCRENPSGPTFPPTKWLLFDDTDCPERTYVSIDKSVTITPPLINQTEKDYVVVAIWYEAPWDIYAPLPTPPAFNYPDGYFAFNTQFNNYEMDSDGILDITLKLYKEC